MIRSPGEHSLLYSYIKVHIYAGMGYLYHVGTRYISIQVSFEHVHFLAKNISEFVSPSLKLHSQYCHIEGAVQIHIEFDDWGHYNA